MKMKEIDCIDYQEMESALYDIFATVKFKDGTYKILTERAKLEEAQIAFKIQQKPFSKRIETGVSTEAE